MHVLYLFSGIQRKASIKDHLLRMTKGKDIKVKVTEVDILRNRRKHDLRPAARRRAFIQKIKAGDYDFVIASPPCGTFSRARWARTPGPKPLRLKHCPRGFPWLWGRAAERGQVRQPLGRLRARRPGGSVRPQ